MVAVIMLEKVIVMNKEEILNKYIDLIDKGYCCDCNELNCIDNFPHTKITHAIKELQQENQKYKEVIGKAIEYLETKRIREKAIIDIDVLEGILNEVE